MKRFSAFYGSQPFEFSRLEPAPLIYSEKDIQEQLRFKRGTNKIKFSYVLLDKNNRRKKVLSNVVSGEISMSSMAEIKRTARFTLYEDKNTNIDWLSDKIQPYCLLKMPNNTWVEWSLGIFLLTSPTRIEKHGEVYREVDAYDEMIILKDDSLTERYIIPAGTNYVTAVHMLLRSAGINKINIEQTEAMLNVDKEYEAGTEKRIVINDLLSAINWTSLWVDEEGYFRANRYISPSKQRPNMNYFDDELSIISSGMKEDLDLAGVPNSWAVVASNPEEEPLAANYINDNPESITSTINRGRTIVDFREKNDISNQEALDEYIERIAFESSQVYGYLEFDTAINPLHSYGDVLGIRYGYLDIEGNYSETNWTMLLQAGAMMRHKARKVVEI